MQKHLRLPFTVRFGGALKGTEIEGDVGPAVDWIAERFPWVGEVVQQFGGAEPQLAAKEKTGPAPARRRRKRRRAGKAVKG